MTQPIWALRGVYRGQTCTIVGKGPGVLRMSPDMIEPGPVIAINQAIQIVAELNLTGPLYTMQKDGPIVPPVYPQILLVHDAESLNIWPDYSPRFVFSNQFDFDQVWSMPSATTAIRIAELFGCTRLVMIGHDAVTTGDLRTIGDGPVPDRGCTESQSMYALIADMVRDTLKRSPIKDVVWR